MSGRARARRGVAQLARLRLRERDQLLHRARRAARDAPPGCWAATRADDRREIPERIEAELRVQAHVDGEYAVVAEQQRMAVGHAARHDFRGDVPPAPGRLSITSGWPRLSASRVPINRAIVSLAPPGGKTEDEADRPGWIAARRHPVLHCGKRPAHAPAAASTTGQQQRRDPAFTRDRPCESPSAPLTKKSVAAAQPALSSSLTTDSAGDNAPAVCLGMAAAVCYSRLERFPRACRLRPLVPSRGETHEPSNAYAACFRPSSRRSTRSLARSASASSRMPMAAQRRTAASRYSARTAKRIRSRSTSASRSSTRCSPRTSIRRA